MISTILSSVFGGLTIVALMMVLFGFRRSLTSDDEVTWWFIKGFGYIIAGYCLRGLYWDVIWQIFRYYQRDWAYWWSDLTGGTAINVVFYCIVLYGAYCVLKSRQAMIPEEERGRWPWWKAWAHPDNLRLLRWPRTRKE